MSKTKIAITLDAELLAELDAMVADARFPNRSKAIEAAVAAQIDRVRRRRLARECAKLDLREEKAMAEEGLSTDAESWPEY